MEGEELQQEEAIQVDQEDEGIGTGFQAQVQGQPTLGLVDLIQGFTMDQAQAQAFAALIQQMVTTSVAGAHAGAECVVLAGGIN